METWRCIHGWPEGKQCTACKKIAALEADNKRLRAENTELQHELTKGIHTCGPACRKTPMCAEMSALRAELAECRERPDCGLATDHTSRIGG